jgi:hypothetical protein
MYKLSVFLNVPQGYKIVVQFFTFKKSHNNLFSFNARLERGQENNRIGKWEYNWDGSRM